MNIWLETLQHLLAAILVALLYLGLATLLFVNLRFLVLNVRSWLTAGQALSPEEEAVSDIVRYQGTFQLKEPGVVRQRFARRYEIRFQNEWACAGRWVPYE